MRRLSLVVLLVCFLSSSVSASIVWKGPTGSWSDPTLWDKGYVPLDDGDEIKLVTDGSVATVNSDVGNYDGTKIAIARDATLEILSGYLGNGKELKVGDAGASGSGTDIGYLTLTGGQLDLTDDGKFEVGYKTGGEGYVTVSGGSLTGDRIYLGGSSSAGSQGTLTIIGADSSISMATMYVGAGSSSGSNPGTGTIEFQIGSAGVSPINLSGTAYLDTAGDDSTAALLLSLIGDPQVGVDIPLINATVEGAFDTVNGAAATEGALVTLQYGGTDYLYNLTYEGSVALAWVPEPATLVLFGLGGLAVARRRRRS